MHPNYEDEGFIANDMCLLNVETMDLGSNVQVVCLPEQDEVPPSGEGCFVGGWGATCNPEDYDCYPTILQSVNNFILPDDQCLNTPVGGDFIGHAELCATKLENDNPVQGNSCNGDSGGPLVCMVDGEARQYGVVSWGLQGCIVEGAPSVYAEVSSYINWMKAVITDDFETTQSPTEITGTGSTEESSTDSDSTGQSTTTTGATTTGGLSSSVPMSTGGTVFSTGGTTEQLTTYEPTTTENETTTTTTTTTATTTTADPCPCMDDSEINYGFTSGLFKYSQIKTLSAGANSLAYAISQTVHDADKVPGMQLEYDGYLVMRKYASCDDTVLAKFADPSVDFHFTDYLCSDCYTTHHTGYHKTDTAAKKRTFTVGYSYSVDDLSNDTNKNGEVDKYVLFITGLQALGVTEQQAYDCVAGAKPSNIWKSSSMIDGCDYSSCVGEKILIW